jgi:uncharacterized protein YdcH (DUF465 family)
MFTIPPYFILQIDDEAGDTGGGGEPEYNLGVPDDYGQETQNDSGEAGGSGTEVKDNPAWQEVYDLLPTEFHSLIQPKLKAWDDNFAKVQSQYSPYKPFLEKNVPFEALQTSMDFANLLNADPEAVYRELGRRFGFSGQGQQQVEEKKPPVQEEQEELFEPQDLSKNPQFAQLQQAYQQLEQRIQQEDNSRQQYQLEQQTVSEINREWAALEAKTGSLPQDVKAEIIRRSIFIADQKGHDAVPMISEGYQDYAGFVSRVRNQRANTSAPDVMSGNGAMPSAKKPMGKMTSDEFEDHIAEMARALSEGNK